MPARQQTLFRLRHTQLNQTTLFAFRHGDDDDNTTNVRVRRCN